MESFFAFFLRFEDLLKKCPAYLAEPLFRKSKLVRESFKDVVCKEGEDSKYNDCYGKAYYNGALAFR